MDYEMHLICFIFYFINGTPFNFYSTQVLPQGGPRSLILFIIQAEGPSTMLRQAEVYRSLHGIPFGYGIINAPHLFFVDDSLFLSLVTTTTLNTLLIILCCYKIILGQSINFQKSSIYFSKAMRATEAGQINCSYFEHFSQSLTK